MRMVVLKAEFQRELVMCQRHLFSSLSDLALAILMFMGIFWGSSSISKGIIGQSLSTLVIGFTLWITIQNTISMLDSNTTNNAKSGILQQLYLMPISSEKLFFDRSMVSITTSLGQSIVVCLALILFTGQWVNFTIRIIWPIIFSLVTLFGLGYLIISLVLKFKRVGSLLTICQYLYLEILLTQFEKAGVLIKDMANLLPPVPMVSWIRVIINGSAYNFKYYLSFSTFNSISWLLLGLSIFEKVNKATKK